MAAMPLNKATGLKQIRDEHGILPIVIFARIIPIEKR